MKLSGNTILITGGSSGIGLSLAKKFLEIGNSVIITGRSTDKLDRARQEEPKLHTIQSDASDPQAVRALADTIASEHPALNVLINNAGVMSHMNLSEPAQDLEKLTAEVDINIAGPIRTISVLIERLKKNRGTIINVSSGLAFVPLQSAAVYCGTKAAIHLYTIGLREQLKSHGVEVIELMPPAVKTDLTDNLPEDGGFKIMTTDELTEATFKGLRAGKEEIRPGQANQLHWMSRIAPGFIQGQMAKGSAGLVPAVEAAL